MEPSLTNDLDQATSSAAKAEDVRHSMTADSAMAAGFCFASGLELASLSVQASSPFPPDLYSFSHAILLAFSFLMLGNFALPPKHPATAFVFDRLGVVFAATAFFIGVAAPFPLWVKCVAWVIYTVSLVAAVAASNLPAALQHFLCSKGR